MVCSGCAVSAPSVLTLSVPQNRHQKIDVAMNDAGTARRCADNMLNASPATFATNVTTHITGTGPNVIVDVRAELHGVGLFNQSVAVTFRCTYTNGNVVIQCPCAITAPLIGVGITRWLRRRREIEEENHHKPSPQRMHIDVRDSS